MERQINATLTFTQINSKYINFPWRMKYIELELLLLSKFKIKFDKLVIENLKNINNTTLYNDIPENTSV